MPNERNIEALAKLITEIVSAPDGEGVIKDGVAKGAQHVLLYRALDPIRLARVLASRGALLPSTMTEGDAIEVSYSAVDTYGNNGEYRQTDRDAMVAALESIACGGGLNGRV